jgi:hypothetical protein
MAVFLILLHFLLFSNRSSADFDIASPTDIDCQADSTSVQECWSNNTACPPYPEKRYNCDCLSRSWHWGHTGTYDNGTIWVNGGSEHTFCSQEQIDLVPVGTAGNKLYDLYIHNGNGTKVGSCHATDGESSWMRTCVQPMFSMPSWKQVMLCQTTLC